MTTRIRLDFSVVYLLEIFAFARLGKEQTERENSAVNPKSKFTICVVGSKISKWAQKCFAMSMSV